MKIKFSFNTKNYGTITNDKPFADRVDMSDNEFGGCVVDFKSVPMIQDYNNAVNGLWCKQLQWDYPNAEITSITTELVD